MNILFFVPVTIWAVLLCAGKFTEYIVGSFAHRMLFLCTIIVTLSSQSLIEFFLPVKGKIKFFSAEIAFWLGFRRGRICIALSKPLHYKLAQTCRTKNITGKI